MKAAIPRQSASPTKRWRPSTSPPIRGIPSGTTSSAQGHQDDAVIVERCLSALVRDPKQDVRLQVARNPATPPEALAALGRDPERDVRLQVAGNAATSPEALAALARDPHWG